MKSISITVVRYLSEQEWIFFFIDVEQESVLVATVQEILYIYMI